MNFTVEDQQGVLTAFEANTLADLIAILPDQGAEIIEIEYRDSRGRRSKEFTAIRKASVRRNKWRTGSTQDAQKQSNGIDGEGNPSGLIQGVQGQFALIR